MLAGGVVAQRATRNAPLRRALCTDEILPGLRRNSFAKRLPRRAELADAAPARKPAPSGSLARVATAVLRPGSADALAAVYNEKVPQLYDGMDGFLGAYLLLDRDANKAQSITLWKSNEDFDAAVARPEYAEVMQQLGGHFLKAPELEVWENAGSFRPPS
eukprot:943332-Prymnesium_polylepis.1